MMRKSCRQKVNGSGCSEVVSTDSTLTKLTTDYALHSRSEIRRDKVLGIVDPKQLLILYS